MGLKERYQTRLDPDDAERVDDYAERHGVTDAEAVRRLIQAGLEAESEAEAEAVPDGGYITRSEHPWVEPLIYLADRSAFAGVMLFLLGMLAVTIPGGAMEWFGATLSPATAAIFLSIFAHLALFGILFGGLALVAILALEYLMHPREAPIRRWFPATWPDEANREVAA